jgi:hypothetical protein
MDPHHGIPAVITDAAAFLLLKLQDNLQKRFLSRTTFPSNLSNIKD